MLSSLLSQFRQRYPQGSLTADLLTIHDGLYVVRVCAGVEGTVLASGLGANTKLEAAEDTATTRALERLCLPAAAPDRPETSLLQPPSPPSLPVVEAAVPPPQSTLLGPAPDAIDPRGRTLTVVPAPAMKAATPPPIALAIPPQPQPEAAPEPAAPTPAPDPEDDEPNEFMDLDPGSALAVDLSDIIAQTDVELQRLGWDVNQGREFLEKTYGKRSRHDLTDDELLEFLLYLETQPTPGSP
ncbi:hypothetical protein [Leptolyngbya sp. KIOST-1]|uniref:hypothetical protein n=1 Tax=Leptolyngbya sp. KIOST-1 TaxID=1229172 RepID=UPI00068A8843|nr:hypothetical protein [Leptolyngbya sp. KIOST-1]